MSSTGEAAGRRDVTVAGESWAITRTGNPQGSFVLVRNATEPQTGDATLHVSLGRRGAVALAPRKTAVWDCGLLEDQAGVTVTAAGQLLYDAAIRCGDAVYLKRAAATVTRTVAPAERKQSSQ